MRRRRRMSPHLAKRLRERYGIKLTYKLLNQICDKVENHDGEFLGRVMTRTEWLVDVNVPMRVVYDEVSKTLSTVLPLHSH